MRDEQGLEPDPGRMRAIRQKVQGRFTRETPQFEIENPKTRLKVSELSEADKRRRETLINEVTARYLRERDDANKGTTMTKQGLAWAGQHDHREQSGRLPTGLSV